MTVRVLATVVQYDNWAPLHLYDEMFLLGRPWETDEQCLARQQRIEYKIGWSCRLSPDSPPTLPRTPSASAPRPLGYA